MTTITEAGEALASAPRRHRGARLLGAVGALVVLVWTAAIFLPFGGDDEDQVHHVHQCQGMTPEACLTKAEGWLLDRSRALSSGSATTAEDFEHALDAANVAFAEIEGFGSTPVYGEGDGQPATAVHYSLTVRTSEGITYVRRTFCPGASPRVLPGKVACS